MLDAWQHLPASVVRPERNKRAHLSSVLSRNEVDRDYAYNRTLFYRVARGHYQFNPALSVRRKVKGEEVWVPVFDALNLRFLNEFLWHFRSPRYEHLNQLQEERVRQYLELA